MGLRLSLLPGHLTQWYDNKLGSLGMHSYRSPTTATPARCSVGRQRGVYSEEKAWQATELLK